jgi:hypothetical protein
LNEFSFSLGKLSKGLVAAAGGLIKYVAVPLVIIYGVIALLESAGGGEFAESLGLNGLMTWVAVLGIAIAALSFFRGFYPKGSRSRMIFGVASMAAAGAWLWVLAKGGDIALAGGDITLGIDYTGIVLLLLVAVALRGLYFVAEMVSCRKEWLAQLP